MKGESAMTTLVDKFNRHNKDWNRYILCAALSLVKCPVEKNAILEN
jgi:hypothetical protein